MCGRSRPWCAGPAAAGQLGYTTAIPEVSRPFVTLTVGAHHLHFASQPLLTSRGLYVAMHASRARELAACWRPASAMDDAAAVSGAPDKSMVDAVMSGSGALMTDSPTGDLVSHSGGASLLSNVNVDMAPTTHEQFTPGFRDS